MFRAIYNTVNYHIVKWQGTISLLIPTEAMHHGGIKKNTCVTRQVVVGKSDSPSIPR